MHLWKAPYFACWAQYGLLAPYFAIAQYGLFAVLCAHARCAHTHGLGRPIGFANTGALSLPQKQLKIVKRPSIT